MIYILTGEIQTGKSTNLTNTIRERNDIGGFITPDVNGMRKILLLPDQKLTEFETRDDIKNVLNIGRFRFLKSSFKLAHRHTIRGCEESKISSIIIDELGKLELKDQGFHSLILSLLQRDWSTKNLIIVVRKSLLNQAIEKYHLNRARIILNEDVLSIF